MCLSAPPLALAVAVENGPGPCVVKTWCGGAG